MSWQWTCERCDKDNDIPAAVEWTLGWRILEKATYEYLTRLDYSSSIIFSAMAFEAELACLFFNKDRINGVAQLLHPAGIEDFVRSDSEILEAVTERFPSLNLGTLAHDFERAVFWPRIRILHTGFTDYGEGAAKTAATLLAWFLISLGEWTSEGDPSPYLPDTTRTLTVQSGPDNFIIGAGGRRVNPPAASTRGRVPAGGGAPGPTPALWPIP